MGKEQLLLTGQKNGEIVDSLGAPPDIIRILSTGMEESEGLVEMVVFDAGVPDLKDTNSLAAYLPDSKLIVIDLAQAMTQRSWMNERGMLLISNVWFNLLFAALHELAHVSQVMDEPELKEFETLPKEFEDEANRMAHSALEGWMENHVIPYLNEMGRWVEKELKSLFNELYVSMPKIVKQELAIQGTNLVALAEDAARKDNKIGRYDTEESVEALLKAIDAGKVGAKIGEERYLTAAEVLGIGADCSLKKEEAGNE